MTGTNNEVLGKIAEDFNASQSDYKVTPVYKGTYPDTLNAGIAAFARIEAPAYPAGLRSRHGDHDGSQGRHQAGLGADAGGRREVRQRRLSACRRGILLEFGRQAGLHAVQQLHPRRLLQQGRVPQSRARSRSAAQDLAGIPRRWPQAGRRRQFLRLHPGLDELDPARSVQRLACRALRLQGQWARWQGCRAGDERAAADPPSRRSDQGRAGPQLRLCRAAGRAGHQVHFGRLRDDPDLVRPLRHGQGQCQIRLRAWRPLPYYPDVADAPQNSIIGGASLWVMGGKTAEEYKGVARFFTFMGQTEIQKNWHQKTGYLPITKAAYAGGQGRRVLPEESGAGDRHPPAARQAADGRYARAAARQSAADPRRHRRGDRDRLWPARKAPRTRSTRPRRAAM